MHRNGLTTTHYSISVFIINWPSGGINMHYQDYIPSHVIHFNLSFPIRINNAAIIKYQLLESGLTEDCVYGTHEDIMLLWNCGSKMGYF